MLFGLAIAKIFEDLKATANGFTDAGESVPSALSSFKSMLDQDEDPELFRFANLNSPYEYLRGGTSLSIPAEWRAYVPYSLEE